jgi:hypothetical protein
MLERPRIHLPISASCIGALQKIEDYPPPPLAKNIHLTEIPSSQAQHGYPLTQFNVLRQITKICRLVLLTLVYYVVIKEG